MRSLKQTLGRQEPKKQKKNHLTTTGYKKKSQLNDLVLSKSPNKTLHDKDLDSVLTQIIQNSFKNNSIINLDKIVKQIVQRCLENQKFHLFFLEQINLNKTVEDKEIKKLEQIKNIVQDILDRNQKICQNNYAVSKFYQQLTNVIKKKNKITKKQKLQQYQKLIRYLSPKMKKNIKMQKTQKIPQFPSESMNNLKVKVTKQQYSIKRQSSPDSSFRMGSEGKRVKTSGRSSHSGLKSDNGNQKLKRFLSKDSNIKLVKTKIQYDYSAIFDASKSKIQTRNKNITTDNIKGQNNADFTTKLNKVKKNQGFVFYRPKTGHPHGNGEHGEQGNKYHKAD